jgi:hypothetical protein
MNQQDDKMSGLAQEVVVWQEWLLQCRSIEIPRLREAGKPKQHPILDYLFGILKIVKGWNENERVVWLRIHFLSETWFSSHSEQGR